MKKQKNTFQIAAASLAGVLLTLGIAACQVGEGVPPIAPPAPTAPPTVTPTPAPTAAPTVAPTVAPTTAPTPSGNPAVPAAVAGVQIDRIGLPGVNTVLVGFNAFTSTLGLTQAQGEAAQNKYNSEQPDTDAANYAAGFSSALQQLFNRTKADADGLAQGVLTPDLLPIDVSKATAFPNGRNLSDDVIDGELQLLSGLSGATDKINANDKAFKTEFPFLAGQN